MFKINSLTMTIGAAAAALLLLALLAACDKEESPEELQRDQQQEILLRVTYMSQPLFMQDFGSRFVQDYPHVRFEVIPLQEQAGGRLQLASMERLEEQEPDLTYSVVGFAQWAQAGKLHNLEPLIRQDEVVMESYSPALLESIRQLGGGLLYGLSPTFQTSALYYNKKLFNEVQLPYPRDLMSWEETLELAGEVVARHGSDARLSGLEAAMTPATLITRFAGSQGLVGFDPATRKAGFDQEGWHEVFAWLIPSYRDGVLRTPVSGMRIDGFPAGESAMALAGPDLYAALTRTPPGFDWELVTEPVNPSRPDESPSIIPSDLFAIYEASPNKETAWAFLAFLLSPAMAEELAEKKPKLLSARMDRTAASDSRNVEAFYLLRPAPLSADPALPQETIQSIAQIMSEEIGRMIKAELPAAEGAAVIQTRVQVEFDRMPR